MKRQKKVIKTWEHLINRRQKKLALMLPVPNQKIYFRRTAHLTGSCILAETMCGHKGGCEIVPLSARLK